MAFSLPVFNLTCEIFTGPYLARVSRLTTLCNLAWGRRIQLSPGAWGGAVDDVSPAMTLLLPALTDVRDGSNAGGPDMIECPQASGRWYLVVGVDDIGKGFANEHRAAWLGKASSAVDSTRYAGLVWPTPIP
jgi:hypothetical protein